MLIFKNKLFIVLVLLFVCNGILYSQNKTADVKNEIKKQRIEKIVKKWFDTELQRLRLNSKHS